VNFLQEPHGVTSQKTPFFIVTAVKTSNLTEFAAAAPLNGMLYDPRMLMDDNSRGAVGGILGNGKPKYLEKTCHSTGLFTANPT
jgi:hypothetical protein